MAPASVSYNCEPFRIRPWNLHLVFEGSVDLGPENRVYLDGSIRRAVPLLKTETGRMNTDKRLTNIEKILESHGRKIDENICKLEENGRKIDENTRQIDHLQLDVTELKEAGRRRDETLTYIINKIDDYREEGRRHLGILLERHDETMRTLLEGIQGNRDRVTDHEARIQKLESA